MIYYKLFTIPFSKQFPSIQDLKILRLSCGDCPIHLNNVYVSNKAFNFTLMKFSSPDTTNWLNSIYPSIMYTKMVCPNCQKELLNTEEAKEYLFNVVDRICEEKGFIKLPNEEIDKLLNYAIEPIIDSLLKIGYSINILNKFPSISNTYGKDIKGLISLFNKKCEELKIKPLSQIWISGEEIIESLYLYLKGK